MDDTGPETPDPPPCPVPGPRLPSTMIPAGYLELESASAVQNNSLRRRPSCPTLVHGSHLLSVILRYPGFSRVVCRRVNRFVLCPIPRLRETRDLGSSKI